MDNDSIWKLFSALYDDLQTNDEYYIRKPLLAHYTSMQVVENILLSDELWFSNPLFMNDLEEIRFGVFHGINVFRSHPAIRSALATEERAEIFSDMLDHILSHFQSEYLLDTYVFCLSEHQGVNRDGLLSMWRGYGGNGNGAALIFDTAKLNPSENTPLILARVHYASAEERITWLTNKAEDFASIVSQNEISNEQLVLAASRAFERIKLFALFSKHQGFSEENEWRAVYLSERDPQRRLAHMLHYANGPRGIEPKLRLKIQPIEGFTSPEFSLDHILSQILLGPTTSSTLAVKSFQRMLDVMGKSNLKNRLVASTIPLRA